MQELKEVFIMRKKYDTIKINQMILIGNSFVLKSDYFIPIFDMDFNMTNKK